MICKKFISRIYLWFVFVFIGMPCLCGMDPFSRAQQAAVTQTSATTVPQPLYNKEDLELIELTFLKTIDIIFDLKDSSNNKSKSVIDISTVPPDFRIFYDYDGEIASITPKDYLKRMRDYFRCTPYCYVIALMYIERFIRRYNIYMNEFHLACFDQFTFHRLYLAAVVAAAKFFDGIDHYYTNKYYAQIGGIAVGELNALERKFLILMGFGDITDFTLSVSKEDFDNFVNRLNHEGESLKKKYPHLFTDMK
ncbi:MAG: cyclin family protein [bacterium]